MPSRDFTNEDLFSSSMMSMHNSTHSSQMKTVGPAMSLRTSCWLLPQNVQWSGFLVSPLLSLFISELRQDTSHHSGNPAGQTRLTHDRELVADLVQRVVLVHADAEAHADYTLLPRRERGERARGGLAQVRLDSRIDRQDRVLVFNEIAEVGILLVADRRFQRQRLLGDLEHLAHLLERHAELLGKLLGRGLAADLVEQQPARTYDLGD